VDPDVARCALAVAAQSGTNINEDKANANHLFIKRSPDFFSMLSKPIASRRQS